MYHLLCQAFEEILLLSTQPQGQGLQHAVSQHEQNQSEIGPSSKAASQPEVASSV